MSQAFVFPLRIAQVILAIIILALMAYVINSWTSPWGSWSPSSANFLLFTSIWTLLVLVYLIIAPLRFQKFSHKFAILAVEFITMIFWFAGFIAFAVLITGCWNSYGVCKASEAAVVFSAFEWVLFLITTVMAALHCWRTKDSGSTKHDPAIEVQQPTSVV
ncbi:membrane-associating domain-containing protein [Halenospora varia]|nr:membrane-associating domain-containing protein [Halenospora varia]